MADLYQTISIKEQIQGITDVGKTIMNTEKIIDDCIFLMLWDTQVDDSGYNNLGMYCDRKSFDPESLKLVTDHILDYIDKNKDTLSKVDEEEIPLHYVMSHNDIFLAAYSDFSKVYAYYR